MNRLLRDHHHALATLHELTQGPLLRDAPSVGGATPAPAPAGATLTPVCVLEDLKVGETLAGAETQTCSVRVLDCKRGDNGLMPDLDATIRSVEPLSLAGVTLSDAGCCGGDASAVLAGIRIDTPIGADANNRVYNADATSAVIAVSGRGVAAGATVTVTVGTLTGVTATATATGTWSVSGLDLKTLAAGYVTVTATDGATTDSLAIYYAKAANTSDLNAAPPQPIPPDLQAASDTGNTTDNATTDTTPTFDVTSPISDDLLGPVPVLLVDGVAVATVETTGITFFDASQPNGLTGSLTPSTALALARHTVQLGLYNDDSTDYYGPPSDPLRISVETEAAPAPLVRYHRRGLTAQVLGVETLWHVDKCPIENPTGLNDLLDGGGS